MKVTIMNRQKKCDIPFQILQKGIFPQMSDVFKLNPKKTLINEVKFFSGKVITITIEKFVTNLKKHYRFARRFWEKIHALKILSMRIVSLHNSIKEIDAYIVTRKVKCMNIYPSNGSFEYKDKYKELYNSFTPSLIDAFLLVSIVIPTLNRYKYLHDVIKDLGKQDYKMKASRQQGKALWMARNYAIKKAVGNYILLYDDSRISSDWISQHLKCLDYFKCDISSGISLSTVGSKIPADYAYFKWNFQIDTGNVMFAKNMMYDTHMFEQQFKKQHMDDGEYESRSYLYRKKNIANPYAKRIHLKAESGSLRQMETWVQNREFFAPRPISSILYLLRKYFRKNTAKVLLIFSVPFSLHPYKYKSNNKLKIVSFLLFIILFSIVPISGDRIMETSEF